MCNHSLPGSESRQRFTLCKASVLFYWYYYGKLSPRENAMQFLKIVYLTHVSLQLLSRVSARTYLSFLFGDHLLTFCLFHLVAVSASLKLYFFGLLSQTIFLKKKPEKITVSSISTSLHKNAAGHIAFCCQQQVCGIFISFQLTSSKLTLVS